ncbi:MAG: YajD family HNH nuclease [Dehalococcoidia bacterium]|nr:YajD family HNH nuclease [Dehalococcoidia bacterium]
MSSKNPLSDEERLKQIIADSLRYQDQRERTYRERALKMFPWVCAWCGREFSGVRLRELTVHHKDHNHENNPPDGSNWELLCIYCHEQMHAQRAKVDPNDIMPGKQKPPATFQPFANLKNLLNIEDPSSREESGKEG